MKKPARERDVRAYARSTQLRLALGGLTLLLTVGIGLIGLIYGWRAAQMGLVCVGLGLSPILLIAAFLGIVDWIVKAGEHE
jgi:hypothetical protein